MSQLEVGVLADSGIVDHSDDYDPVAVSQWSWKFRILKSALDVAFVLAALPIVAGMSAALLLLNPFFNQGPLFFKQDRMGLGGRRFSMWKYRSMSASAQMVRDPDSPVEHHRITPLGRILRRSRLDELPNVFNIISGDMTLIGPRPDAWDHATKHVMTVPKYRDRFRVKPGITGLAQVQNGYADNPGAIQRKAQFDSYYVRHSHGRMDLRVLWSTVRIVLTGSGAK
jgi:lipopolysaccharide/colanic/teichoic acid biosynthesis glycosyltransferase